MTKARIGSVGLLAAIVLASTGCASGFISRDQSPAMLVIDNLQATSGGLNQTGGTLQSDVITVVDGVTTLFSDAGSVTMRAIMKNPGTPENPVAPTAVNGVTVSRYRITFERTDGRNTPGVDVPHPFDSAVTFTIDIGEQATQGFELIRHIAKQEAPLAALALNETIISTIATITFYGRDQAGNELSVSGRIGIDFGNFADPN